MSTRDPVPRWRTVADGRLSGWEVSTSREAGQEVTVGVARGRRSWQGWILCFSAALHLRFDMGCFTQFPADLRNPAIVVWRCRAAMQESDPVVPMTALVVDDDGRLTYLGEDGRRRVIVGDQDLLRRVMQIRDQSGDLEGGCGI